MLKAQGTGKECPHKKAATLLPSFTVTPTTTESTASPRTSHRPITTTHGNITVHPTSNTTSSGPSTSTQNPATTTSHGNATVHPTTNNGTATSPGFTTTTTGPHPGPYPPSPSPSPGSTATLGNYTWTNGSQPCAQLQAQIQIRILYPTQSGGKVKLRARVKSCCGQKEENRGGDKKHCMAQPCNFRLTIFSLL